MPVQEQRTSQETETSKCVVTRAHCLTTLLTHDSCKDESNILQWCNLTLKSKL